MARNDEPKAEGEAVVVEAADGPLLDLTDAAVKRMIKIAKKRGWVTQDELNAVLPSEEISSDQIEDMNAMLSEMGINVVDTRTPKRPRRRPAEAAADEEEPERGELVEARARPRSPPAAPSRPSAPTIPCACICARWARSSCCRARARSPSPSASRPAARR